MSKSIPRIKLEKKIALCLDTRSRIVPIKGPISEYGNKTVAKASAALRALVCLSGEKRIKEASAL